MSSVEVKLLIPMFEAKMKKKFHFMVLS